MLYLIKRRRAGTSPEGGFSLIEAVASLGIVAIITLTLTAAMINSYRTVRNARFDQQASAVGAEEVEWARSVEFDSLSMATDDATMAGDTRLSSCTPPSGFTYAFDPDGSGSLGCEPVVSSQTSTSIPSHQFTRSYDGQTYTIYNYVTWVNVDGSGDVKDVKRFVTLVEHTRQGVTESYRTSTIVGRARAGLPVPNFNASPAARSRAVQPGGRPVFAHTIQNIGIQDVYEVEVEVPEGRSWSPQVYKDVNANQAYDVGIDTLLTDTNLDGAVDTGKLATGATFNFLATWELSGAEPLGTDQFKIFVRSSIDKSIQRTITDKLKVGDATLELFLHNFPTPPDANTVAQRGLPMDENVPTATTLFSYASDWNAGAGRYVKKDGKHDEDSIEKMLYWVTQMSEATTFDGDGTLKVWVSNPSGECTKKIKLRGALRYKPDAIQDKGGGVVKFKDATNLDFTPAAGAACQFYELTLNFNDIDNKTVPINYWLEVKVWLDGDAAHGFFAYDTTLYPAKLTLPQVFI